MNKLLFIVFTATVLLLGGCTDKAEQIPAYLDLKPFVVDEPGGAAWHKITDGWLYVNGEFLGAYTLPATVPVLAEGESEVILFPGVKENGILATPNIYPFMKRYETTVTLSPAENTAVNPSTSYDDDAMFPWEGRSDFDGSTAVQFEDRDGDDDTGYILTENGAFAGKSLLMAVDTAHWLMEIASEKVDELPLASERQVWLELHYNSDMPFTLYLLGSIGNSSEIAQPVFQFNTTGGWNKTYINLTEFVSASLQENYRLFFRASLPRDNSNKFSQITGSVMLDNIRLVHF